MRWIGLDLGAKTIGVAVSDEDAVVATPSRTLSRQGGARGSGRDLEAVAEVYSEVAAQGIVFGLPLTLDGRETDAARRVRQLGQRLAERLGCPVRYWDERFTTVQAERTLLQADMSRKKRRQVIDKLAAAIILQSFLDHARTGAEG